MKNIYSQIPERSREITPLVIATVIFTRGSAPQKAGSSALFSKDGLTDGTIGGGFLENEVKKLAKEAALTGSSGIYHFELDKSIEHKTEAICGGHASVLIESGVEKYESLCKSADEYLAAGKRCAMVTIIKGISRNIPEISRLIVSGESQSNLPDNIRKKVQTILDQLLNDPSGAGFSRIETGKAGEITDELILLESLCPLPRLIIAGAGHIGKALSHIGRLLDFEVLVIDDRKEFANQENLPDASQVIVKDVGKAISEMRLACDSYVVIVTRGHNDDSAALRNCITSEAGYIGMIGSKTKIEKMRRNFLENGWASEEQWNSIHAPVGIEINSKTVEEIAVSIASELIMERNKSKK
jgi:xanthine dehydrogenase accessory factor